MQSQISDLRDKLTDASAVVQFVEQIPCFPKSLVSGWCQLDVAHQIYEVHRDSQHEKDQKPVRAGGPGWLWLAVHRYWAFQQVPVAGDNLTRGQFRSMQSVSPCRNNCSEPGLLAAPVGDLKSLLCGYSNAINHPFLMVNISPIKNGDEWGDGLFIIAIPTLLQWTEDISATWCPLLR